MEEKDIMTTAAEEDTSTVAEEPTTETAPVAEETAPDTTEEKESTIELREAFEEATATEAPKKKKRKLSKGKIALICVASFILLVGIGVGLFFLIGHLLYEPYVPVEVEFDNKRPDVAVTFSAGDLALIKSAMKSGASEQTIKDAIAMMYAKANDNKINHSAQAVAVLRGEGSAAIEFLGSKPNGTMIVRGIKAQAGNEFYYQKGAKLVKCSVESVKSMLEGSLNQQERAYTDGTTERLLTGTLKGKNAKIVKEPETKTIPFVAVGVPSKVTSYDNQEDFYENGFYLDDPREITNFRISADTIVLNELEEGVKRIEYNDKEKYYTLRFSLLIKGEGHDDCVEIARRYLRKSANSTDLEYERFDVTLQIWDNGYLKMMHDEEIWVGTAEMGGFDITTSSRSWYESILYYDFDAALFTEEDAAAYEGDDWATKLIAHYKAELDTAKKESPKKK